MTVKILKGDCRDVLRTLPDESVHCVVTSPPYWGLRDYGVAGQIGLEGSFAGYVEIMRNVFAEVRRVLRKDGTLWLNLGDSYNNRTKVRTTSHQPALNGFADDNWAERAAKGGVRMSSANGIKEKDLCGIPWRVAFALQADGWWLRQDIIWSKPNPMPESVTDRCTKAHEYLFLLAKSERYFYDADAIKEAAIHEGRVVKATGADAQNGQKGEFGRTAAGFTKHDTIVTNRNKRSVWEILTAPFPEAHFATFPPALIEPCILAGTSEKGCCAKCGAPWVREVERGEAKRIGGMTGCLKDNKASGPMNRGGHSQWDAGHLVKVRDSSTTGWSPSCSCQAANPYTAAYDIVPCTVLDPFGGAGTTGLVADRLGRSAILIELNPQYAEMADRRLRQDAGMFADVH